MSRMRADYRRVLGGVRIALACAACLVPIRASAFSCATNWVRAPSDGATDVPTNMRLWGIGSQGSTRIIGPTGAVGLEQRYLRIARSATEVTVLTMLVPTRELEPNASYVIEIDSGAEYPIERMRFVTGAGPAQQPPLVPELLSNEPRAGGLYGYGRYRALEFSHGPIIIGDAYGALGSLSSVTELELNEIPERQPLEPASAIVRWASSDALIDVGLSDCTVWPDAAADQVQARFGAFDLAGNFSGWLEPPALVLPTEAEAVLLIEQQNAEREAEHQALLLQAYGEPGDDGPPLLSQCAMAPRPPRWREPILQWSFAGARRRARPPTWRPAAKAMTLFEVA